MNKRVRSFLIVFGVPLCLGGGWLTMDLLGNGNSIGATGSQLAADPAFASTDDFASTLSAGKKTSQKTNSPGGGTYVSSGKGSVVVEVKGAVKNAGVFTMAAGTRVHDAIDAAGGLTADANPERINLAAKLEDGGQIVVPGKSDNSKDSQSGSNTSTQVPVSINNATLEQLSAVPGLSRTKAREIITYRTQNGPFLRIDDLLKVKGITAKLLSQLRQNLSVN